MDNNQIIKAGFSDGGYFRTRPVFQYDYGHKLMLDGFDLPQSFEVHFSKGNGQSITVIGSDYQVEIPDECFQKAATVVAWIFLHDTGSDGETRFVIEIPVKGRAEITNQEPTPVQQDVIAQTIAALNEGIRTVEGIAEEIPQTIEDALTEAKESGEFDGEDGYTPIKGVDYFDGEPGQDGYTPIKGVDYFDGYTPVKGVDYFDGAPGEPGDDGYSPSVAVSEITGGHQVTITDKTGTRSVDVMDGAKGDDGISPVASVSKSGNTATITITDKTGTTSATVSDGAALIDDTAGAGDTDKAWSADKIAGELNNLNGAINDLSESLPTEETAQELLENEFYNTGLTDTTLAVIGMIFNNLPQDEPAIDVVNSLSLECERLQAIYENWMSERGA